MMLLPGAGAADGCDIPRSTGWRPGQLWSWAPSRVGSYCLCPFAAPGAGEDRAQGPKMCQFFPLIIHVGCTLCMVQPFLPQKLGEEAGFAPL